MKPLRIGCSGWNYRDWREPVYGGAPAREWLALYAQLFDTVEVNNTFYRLPERRTVAGWAESAPDGFLFSCKASRYLTHVKRLAGIGHGIRRMRGRLAPLAEAGKLGPILWQLPANFRCDPARIERVLELVAGHGERHAFEFRDPSWFNDDVYALLRDAGAALVVADHPERRFNEHEMTTSWTYVRWHWGARGRRGNYSRAELASWRRRIAAWRRRTEVFGYFNNDWEAFAPRNALFLLGRSGLSSG